MTKLWLYASLMLLIGCAPAERSARQAGADDPAAAFTSLEDRLLNAAIVRLDFHVTAEGAVDIELHGALDIDHANHVRLTASGHFAGQPVELLLRAEDGDLELANGPRRSVAERPADLDAAILIGFTRMAILHNLARLTGTMAPDHADGGVMEWVAVGPFDADADDTDAIAFEITVAEQSAGSASLELDSRGRPVVRRQTVRFPTGEMRVVERYSGVRVEP